MSDEKPAATKATPIERLLDLLERAWRDRKEPDGLFRKLLRWIRWLLTGVTALYWISLVTILLLLEYVGEKHLTLAYLVYLPAHGWLLPIFVLAPVCLLFHPKLSLAYLPAVVLVLWFYMGYRVSSWEEPDPGRGFTILVNNTGQSGGNSLTPFIEQERPDIIALQEAGRERQYREAYPELHVKAEGEFTLISRFPILSSELVKEVGWYDQPVMARFVVEIHGREVAIYNVHMPSPRDDLSKASGRAMLVGFAWGDGYLGQTKQRLHEPWRARVLLAEDLAKWITTETLPVLAVGDFNMPDHGAVYNTISAGLTDSFAEKGKGYGFTFPGETRNPLTFFGPWLRIDYIFCGSDFEPTYARAEPHRKSQHRAVVASFNFAE